MNNPEPNVPTIPPIPTAPGIPPLPGAPPSERQEPGIPPVYLPTQTPGYATPNLHYPAPNTGYPSPNTPYSPPLPMTVTVANPKNKPKKWWKKETAPTYGYGFGYGMAAPMISCRVCGEMLAPYFSVCGRCRTPIANIADPNDPTSTRFISLDARISPPNGSGQAGAVAPPEVKGVCWGPLIPLVTPFWCMSNGMPLGLLLIVTALIAVGTPWLLMVNILASLYLFARGGPLSWRLRRFTGVDQFKQVQRNWAVAALVAAIFCAIIWLAYAAGS